MPEVMWCPNCKGNRRVQPKTGDTQLNPWTFSVLAVVYNAYCDRYKRQCAECGTSSKYMQPPKKL